MPKHCRDSKHYSDLAETIQAIHEKGAHVAGLILIRINHEHKGVEAQILWSAEMPDSGERKALLETLAEDEAE